jgi:hypothetical protein
VALASAVYITTGSVVATGLIFFAATLLNLTSARSRHPG